MGTFPKHQVSIIPPDVMFIPRTICGYIPLRWIQSSPYKCVKPTQPGGYSPRPIFIEAPIQPVGRFNIPLFRTVPTARFLHPPQDSRYSSSIAVCKVLPIGYLEYPNPRWVHFPPLSVHPVNTWWVQCTPPNGYLPQPYGRYTPHRPGGYSQQISVGTVNKPRRVQSPTHGWVSPHPPVGVNPIPVRFIPHHTLGTVPNNRCVHSVLFVGYNPQPQLRTFRHPLWVQTPAGYIPQSVQSPSSL
jgi:hypothetical protein